MRWRSWTKDGRMVAFRTFSPTLLLAWMVTCRWSQLISLLFSLFLFWMKRIKKAKTTHFFSNCTCAVLHLKVLQTRIHHKRIDRFASTGSFWCARINTNTNEARWVYLGLIFTCVLHSTDPWKPIAFWHLAKLCVNDLRGLTAPFQRETATSFHGRRTLDHGSHWKKTVFITWPSIALIDPLPIFWVNLAYQDVAMWPQMM